MRCTLKATLLFLAFASPALLSAYDRPWRHHHGFEPRGPMVVGGWGRSYGPRVIPAPVRPRHLVGFIPGDPHHAYWYDDGRWVLRRMEYSRHPYACEPYVEVLPPRLSFALPRAGLSLSWVLE